MCPRAWQNGCCTKRCHDNWFLNLLCGTAHPSPLCWVLNKKTERSLFSIPRKTSPQLSEEQKQQDTWEYLPEPRVVKERDGCHTARVCGRGCGPCPPAGWQCPLHDQSRSHLNRSVQVSATDAEESPAERGPGLESHLTWLAASVGCRVEAVPLGPAVVSLQTACLC